MVLFHWLMTSIGIEMLVVVFFFSIFFNAYAVIFLCRRYCVTIRGLIENSKDLFMEDVR